MCMHCTASENREGAALASCNRTFSEGLTALYAHAGLTEDGAASEDGADNEALQSSSHSALRDCAIWRLTDGPGREPGGRRGRRPWPTAPLPGAWTSCCRCATGVSHRG